MKASQLLFVLGLVASTACQPEIAASREVEVVLTSSGGKLTQKVAADVVVTMLGSNAYATEILRRLPAEDGKLFAKAEELQARLSAKASSEGKWVRIVFKFRDAAV